MKQTDLKYERHLSILERLVEKYGDSKILDMLVNISGYQEMRKAAHESLDMYDDNDIHDFVNESRQRQLDFNDDCADRARGMK